MAKRHVRDEPREPPPTIAHEPAPRLLHRPREQPLHEVALEGEEDGERDRHREERGRRDQLDVGPELPELGEDRDRDRLGRLAEGQRDEQVVPDPEELEDRERRDRGQPERKDQPREDPELGRAVDARGLDQVLRIPRKKFRSRKIANGSPNAVWNRISPRIVSKSPRSL